MESTAMGLAAGLNALRLLNNKELVSWPDESIIGSLIRYLNTANTKHFQPMNANLGIFPALDVKIKDKKLKALQIRERAVTSAQKFWESFNE